MQESVVIVIKELNVKNVLTKSNLPVCDYSANPYVGCTHGCRYCYASFMKRFTGHEENWGTFLDVKYWPEIKNLNKLDGKEIFIGSVTDPYLPEEAEYRRTRALLEDLRKCNVKLSISTKSNLILRDLDLLKSFRSVRVAWSVNTLDENFRCSMDRASSIEDRLSAMEIFHKEGIATTCFISPIFPGITDAKAIIERVKNFCNYIWLENLNLRGTFKADILNFIKDEYPDLFPLYDLIYNKGDLSYWKDAEEDIRAYASSIGLPYIINDDSIEHPFDSPPLIVNYFYHSKIKKNRQRLSYGR